MTVLIVPDRYPALFVEDFANGIGHWTAGIPPAIVGGPREVVNGVFRSFSWGYDNNHLTTKGGPGMLHLMAYADFQYWQDGADFTNARIKLRVRGDNFDPNGSQFICWITATHPYVPNKNVNWGFVAEPRTAALTSGNWEDVEWVLTPDPTKWVFGKGENGGIYDTFLSLQESLQNICNIHFLTLGPDDVGHPTGTFELDSCEILYNRKTADAPAAGFRWGNKAPAVSLSGGDLIAAHAPFTATGGVRSNSPLPNGAYWETTHLSGSTALCFASGVCNASYDPVLHGGTFFADTANGWGYLIDQGEKRHGGPATDVAWGPTPLPSGVTLMHAFKDGKYWQGANGVWFSSGDPATDTNPMFSGLTGDIYAIESNGTGNGSWQWRTNFGASAFTYSPPAGFSGPDQ